VAARQLAGALADSLGILDQTVDFQQKRVREGALVEADLIRVQIERHRLVIQHRGAEQTARRQFQLLFREIGMPMEAQTTLTGDLAAFQPVDIGDIDEAVERRKDIQLAVQAVRQARASVRLQKANAVPDPEALFGYKRTAGLNTVVAGLQINLPIQNRNQGSIAAAEADGAAAAATLRAGRLAARTEIEALAGEYSQKREVLEQMLPGLRGQADETRRIAAEVYREGASDLLRLLDAERLPKCRVELPADLRNDFGRDAAFAKCFQRLYDQAALRQLEPGLFEGCVFEGEFSPAHSV
jgi:cobalt-zinc-cadmium efflux system outer membrane protein